MKWLDKTLSINLWKAKWTEPVAWSIDESDNIEPYIEFSIFFNRYVGFCFDVSVVNRSFCYRNPFTCWRRALESETVGNWKYGRLKDRVRDIGC